MPWPAPRSTGERHSNEYSQVLAPPARAQALIFRAARAPVVWATIDRAGHLDAADDPGARYREATTAWFYWRLKGDADAATHLHQGNRQVDRHGGLADAALSCADRDHVLHAGQGGPVGFRRRCGAHLCGELHVDVGDAKCSNRRDRLLAHLILDRTCRRRQFDGERHASTGDLQILHEAERHDVATKVRVGYRAQRIEHGVAVERRHIT